MKTTLAIFVVLLLPLLAGCPSAPLSQVNCDTINGQAKPVGCK